MIANNSSGMTCGTTANAYRTIDSMSIALPRGKAGFGRDEDSRRRALEVARSTPRDDVPVLLLHGYLGSPGNFGPPARAHPPRGVGSRGGIQPLPVVAKARYVLLEVRLRNALVGEASSYYLS